ncbi:AAA family ATPase [Adonisia turfae]|uniref:Serine protease n=1 Tax=Adonisia turfae CCMR0081 TaxID=2292702 RepID=A0A6M0RMT2_9CYAN|nr:AAA family ATPase [Adonisia turfae]NEZ57585.1 serine protease [Adonisia turfae CCMR0081]
MSTSSPNLRFAFHNQVQALKWVDRSRGELLVLDALPGYGKTAFLTKLKTKYETQKWRCSLISFKRARSKLDAVTATIEEISTEPIESPEDLDQALDVLLKQLQSRQPQALMFDDVHYLEKEALDWVKRELASELKQELKDLTDDNFLLIFSGHSICGPTRWPTIRKPIKLTAFHREVINHFIEKNNISVLWQDRSQNYCPSVVDRIFQFSGGHPRASLGLLQELKDGWIPSRSLRRRKDLRVFEKHVQKELSKFVENLDPVYQTYLSHLIIFRYVDVPVLEFIKQKYQVSVKQTDLKLIEKFLQCNLLYSPSNSLGMKALDPVFRLSSLAKMLFKDPEQYSKQHKSAQEIYQNWAATKNWSYDVIRCLKESIYHCLSRMEGKECLEEPSELIDCLRYGIRILNHKQTEMIDPPKSVLETLLDDDEEIQYLLQKLEIDWIKLLKYSFFAYSGTAITVIDIPTVNQTVQDQCKTMTTVLINDIGEVSGTGFWIALNQQYYVVTCAHVIKQLKSSEGDLVKVRTFGPNAQDLDLKVLWYRVPSSQSEKDWSARQDIAILGLVSEKELRLSIGCWSNLLPLSDEPININGYQKISPLYSFGYPASKHLKGDSFPSLVFKEKVANGFIKLLNRGSNSVEGGVSGAPLCHIEGEHLVAMIHAKSGTDVVYCIPSTTILDVLKDVRSCL